MTQTAAFYTFQANEYNPKAYDILACRKGSMPPAKVGDYTVLEEGEERSLTEKKLINLVTLLNGGSDLIDIGALTKTRLLFRRVPNTADQEGSRLLFYSFKGEGVSRENALLVLDKGVDFDE